MRNAILHIGTEKTGSTSIQNFLYKNEKKLADIGFYYPYKSCGLISNFRLVLYALNKPDAALMHAKEHASIPLESSADTERHHDAWKKLFVADHAQAIRNYQARHSKTTVVYSSEHFHSRVHDREEIERLKTLFDEFYDDVLIILYMRRQDRLAVSAHNTAIQGGRTSVFNFSNIKGMPRYYDYLSLINRWAEVFGDERVSPVIYERDKLAEGDVARDFKSRVVKRRISDRISIRNYRYENANPRLSYTALNTLMEFNKLEQNDPVLSGKPKESIRQELISKLHEVKDEYGEQLPARASAISFYNRFRDNNDTISKKWLKGVAFSDDFSMYPTTDNAFPTIDSKSILEDLLAKVVYSNR